MSFCAIFLALAFVGVTHAGEAISGKPRVFAGDTLANRQTKIRIQEIDV